MNELLTLTNNFQLEQPEVLPANIVSQLLTEKSDRQDYIPEAYRIKKVIHSGSKTIVLWRDGSKTIATCSKEDIQDDYTGLMVCILKRLFGTKVFHNIMSQMDKKLVTYKQPVQAEVEVPKKTKTVGSRKRVRK